MIPRDLLITWDTLDITWHNDFFHYPDENCSYTIKRPPDVELSKPIDPWLERIGYND